MGVVVRMRIGCLAASVAFAVTGFALADSDDDDRDRRHEAAEQAIHGAETGELMPFASIVASVRQKYPGEILETEFETSGGQPYYEFHILRDDGRVIEIKVDARDGRYRDSATGD